MATMRYTLSSFTDTNNDLKAGDGFTCYAEGTAIANGVVTAARLYLSAFRTYSSYCRLVLSLGGGSGETENYASDSTVHSELVDLVSFSNQLVRAGSDQLFFTVKRTNTGTGNLINVRAGCEGYLEIDYYIPQSDFTLNLSTVDAGQQIGAYITPTASSASHNVIWSLTTEHGSRTQTVTEVAGKTSAFYSYFTVPLEWINIIKTSESATASCKVETVIGGAVTGSVTKYFTIHVPNSVVPTFSSLAAAPINSGMPSAWAFYLQGYSGVRLTATGAAGAYGSTINAYAFSGGGYNVSQSGNVYEGVALNASGDVTFTCIVTDSRGRTASKTVTVSFVAYAKPQITGLTAVRCDAAGTAKNDGTYAKVFPLYTFAPVLSGGVNQNSIKSMAMKYKLLAATDYTQDNADIVASGGNKVIGNGNLNASKSYYVQLILTDQLDNQAERLILLPTAKGIMHFKRNGLGVAVGKIAENDHEFEIASDFRLRANGEIIGVPSNPNILVNGDFQVWQAGTSFAATGYTADMWYWNGGTSPVVKATASDGANALQMTPAGTWKTIRQYVENPLYLSGKIVTISVRAKGSNFYVAVQVNSVDKGSILYPDTAADPVTLSVTFTMPVLSSGDVVTVIFGNRATYGAAIIVDWIKLELGAVATPHIHRPYAQELLLCRRHFIAYGGRYKFLGTGTTEAATIAQVYIPFPTAMRIAPTVYLTPIANARIKVGTTSYTVTGINSITIDDGISMGFLSVASSGLTAGMSCVLATTEACMLYLDARIYP